MKRLLVLIMLLSGCSRLPPLPFIPASQLESWDLNGRIAIVTEDNNWTANVYWQQRGQNYQMRLNTPLGQGALLLEGDDKGVVMRTADKQTYKASDPDTLVAKVLKINIPVTDLYYWIRGIPTPKTVPIHYLLEMGHLQRLQQDDWDIEYKHYVNVQGLDLPKKIFLENDRFKVKIVISQWSIANFKYLPSLVYMFQ